MRVYFGLSLFRLSLLVSFYALLMGIFTLKTVYYFSYQNTVWWMYFCVITLIFLYAAYHFITHKPNRGAVLLIASLTIGYMPFEVHIPAVVELIKNHTTNLSGLAEKIPLAIGILFKMLFYPIITAIPFALMQFTIKEFGKSNKKV